MECPTIFHIVGIHESSDINTLDKVETLRDTASSKARAASIQLGAATFLGLSLVSLHSVETANAPGGKIILFANVAMSSLLVATGARDTMRSTQASNRADSLENAMIIESRSS